MGLLAKRSLLFIFVLTLLLASAPRLLVAGANNLAVLALVPEWGGLRQEVGFPHCEKRLETSAGERYLSQALHWDPAHQRALLNHGRVAWLEGHCSEARTNWEQALRAAPGDQTAAFWLFWASEFDTDKLPEGLLAENMARYASKAGRRAEIAGAESTAMAWYKLSLDLSPGREAGGRLARLHQREGRVEEAIAVWRQVAAALPQEDADHWWTLGQAAELAQEWELAAWAYGRGAEIAEEPYGFWIRQGDALLRLRRWEEAEGAYRQALAARPDLLEPYLGLGHLGRDQGNYEDALEWYMEAQAVAPGNVRPPYYMGRTHYLQGQDAQARAWFEAALRIDPDHPWSNRCLAQTLYRTGEEAEAVTFLARAVDLLQRQPWQWAVQLGDWRLELGDREGALAAYRRALEWGPGEAGIQERIEQVMGEED